jgi:hypothetical protein
LVFAGAFALAACGPKAQTNSQPAQPVGPYGQYPQGQYPPGPYPYPPPAPGQYPPAPPGQPPAPQPQPQARPLLAPLIGQPAQEAEVRSIMTELINSLSAQNKPLVQGIPLSVDPTPEVNAYAGCDDNGNPYMAATAGILEAADAIGQTKATDELFGTHTYDQYCAQVLPQVVASPKARSALPAGIIPMQYGADPRRWSRAREVFDDVLAFTFGHELAHHYLGHTGCAHGQPLGAPPVLMNAGRIASRIPWINQFNESAADSAGILDVLDAGRARRPQYEWSEYGAVTLLDYFARLEKAAGGGGPLSLLNPLAVLQDHPNPLIRIPIVQTFAQNWHRQHP